MITYDLICYLCNKMPTLVILRFILTLKKWTVEGFIKTLFWILFGREGLEWTDIDWVDNGECLDLIEKVKQAFSKV